MPGSVGQCKVGQCYTLITPLFSAGCCCEPGTVSGVFNVTPGLDHKNLCTLPTNNHRLHLLCCQVAALVLVAQVCMVSVRCVQGGTRDLLPLAPSVRSERPYYSCVHSSSIQL